MSKRGSLVLGLGAAAILFATPFAVSSCKSTGRRLSQEKTMMKSGDVGQNLTTEGRNAEVHEDCGCKLKCSSSCGGEGLEGSCGKESCKSK